MPVIVIVNPINQEQRELVQEHGEKWEVIAQPQTPVNKKSHYCKSIFTGKTAWWSRFQCTVHSSPVITMGEYMKFFEKPKDQNYRLGQALMNYFHPALPGPDPAIFYEKNDVKASEAFFKKYVMMESES